MKKDYYCCGITVFSQLFGQRKSGLGRSHYDARSYPSKTARQEVSETFLKCKH